MRANRNRYFVVRNGPFECKNVHNDARTHDTTRGAHRTKPRRRVVSVCVCVLLLPACLPLRFSLPLLLRNNKEPQPTTDIVRRLWEWCVKLSCCVFHGAMAALGLAACVLLLAAASNAIFLENVRQN